jgi:hypothetical protein
MAFMHDGPHCRAAAVWLNARRKRTESRAPPVAACRSRPGYRACRRGCATPVTTAMQFVLREHEQQLSADAARRPGVTRSLAVRREPPLVAVLPVGVERDVRGDRICDPLLDRASARPRRRRTNRDSRSSQGPGHSSTVRPRCRRRRAGCASSSSGRMPSGVNRYRCAYFSMSWPVSRLKICASSSVAPLL